MGSRLGCVSLQEDNTLIDIQPSKDNPYKNIDNETKEDEYDPNSQHNHAYNPNALSMNTQPEGHPPPPDACQNPIENAEKALPSVANSDPLPPQKPKQLPQRPVNPILSAPRPSSSTYTPQEYILSQTNAKSLSPDMNSGNHLGNASPALPLSSQSRYRANTVPITLAMGGDDDTTNDAEIARIMQEEANKDSKWEKERNKIAKQFGTNVSEQRKSFSTFQQKRKGKE